MILQLKIETSPGVFRYKPLDVFEDFEVTYNHQFEDYKSLSGRKIPYTNKFKIPTTENNRILCGLPIDANYPTSRDIDGKMYYSNGLIAFDFIATIEGQEIDTLQPYIEISIIDIISNALKELNKWKMSDFFADANNPQRRYLDLSTDTWVYGEDNLTNTSLDEMFTFPFYNFNNKTIMFSHDPMRKLSQIQPTFVLWKLIENIFSFAGISVNSDFLKLDNQLYPGIKANELGLMIPMIPKTSETVSWSEDCKFAGVNGDQYITQPRLAGVPNMFPSSAYLTPNNFLVSATATNGLKFNYDTESDKYDNPGPLTSTALEELRAEENNATLGSFCATVDGEAKITLSNLPLNTDPVYFYISQLSRQEGDISWSDGILFPNQLDGWGILYPKESYDNETIPDMDVRMVVSDEMEPISGDWYGQGWSTTSASYNFNDSVVCGTAIYESIVPPSKLGPQNTSNWNIRTGLKFRIEFNESTEMLLKLQANKRINISFIIAPKDNSTVTINTKWENQFFLSSTITTHNISTEITQGYIKHSVIGTEQTGWEDTSILAGRYVWSGTPLDDVEGSEYIFPVNLAMDFVEPTELPPVVPRYWVSPEPEIEFPDIDMVESMKSIKDYKLIDIVKMVSQRFNLKFYSTSDGIIHLDTNKNRLSGQSYNIDHLIDEGTSVQFTDNEVGIVNIKDTNPSFYDTDYNRLDNNIVSDTKRDEITIGFTTSIVNEKMFRDEYDDSSFGLLATGLSSNYFGVSDRKQASVSELKPLFTFLKGNVNELWSPINECSISTYNYDPDYAEPQLDAAFYNYFKKGVNSTHLEATAIHDTGFKLVSFVDDKAPIESRNLYMQTWFQNIMDRVNDESVIISPDLYVSEATLKYIMDFPTILYKGSEWEYQGLNNYPLSDRYGGISNIKLIKKKVWERNGAPTMPLNHIVDTSVPGGITTSWDASTDDIDVTSYKVYLDGNLVFTQTNTSVLSYQHIGLELNQDYIIGVSATDADGNESEVNWVNVNSNMYVDVEAPGVPLNITYSNYTCDGLTMSWEAPYDDFGIASYNIYSSGVLIDNVKTLSYDYSNFPSNTVIQTSVSALDFAGNESFLSTTSNQTTLVQCPPTNLSIGTVGTDSIEFLWDASNDPAVNTYLVTLDGSNSVLLEPEATNTATDSNDFTTGDIFVSSGNPSVSNVVLTSVQATSPDGTNNAWKLADNNDGNTGQCALNYFNTTVISEDYNTLSLFVKKQGNNDWMYINNFGFDATSRSWFNISNGTLGTVASGHTASIDDYGNGWYRIAITFTTEIDLNGGINIRLATSDGATFILRDGTNGVYIYGLQAESHATRQYATSYIPTSGGTANRPAPSTNYTFTGLTEGQLYTLGVSHVAENIYTSSESTITHFIPLPASAYSEVIVSNGYLTESLACNSTDVTAVYWHDGVSVYPVSGDRIRTTEAFNVDPPDGFYRIADNGSIMEVLSGIVSDLTICQ